MIPRSAALLLASTGRLLCAHMETHTLCVLPLDPEAGALATPTSTVPAPSPICILFGR